MKFKFAIVICYLLLVCKGYSQDINGYKYIVIPKKFDFQKVENKYQLNSLTKFLFDKEGFLTLVENEKLPDDLYNNPCLGLKATVLDNSNMFTTKLAIQLSNCRGAIVYTTEEGKSKIKDIKKGQHDALRKTFQAIKALDYSYNEKLSSTLSHKEDNVAKEMPSKDVVKKDVIENHSDKSKDNVSINLEDKAKTPLEKIQEQVKIEDSAANETNENNLYVLYAQEIPNGYQLVDNTPKIVFVALKSTTQDLYYLKNKAGILFKEGASWYAEYYDATTNKLIKKELNIKF